MRDNSVQHVHLIGIGGAGMQGIAQILLAQGVRVSGSDVAVLDASHPLRLAGATLYDTHSAEHVGEADVVVHSSAIGTDNIEMQTARALQVPLLHRSEMLAQLVESAHGIAVAGTHGKTSTSAMIAHVLRATGMQPSFVVGEAMVACGQRAQWDAGRVFVYEADESDGSFLHYRPDLAVITSIQLDHMGRYDHDLDVLLQSFRDFVDRLRPGGSVILCVEDAGVRRLQTMLTTPVITYGLSIDADVYATNLSVHHGHQHFVLHHRDDDGVVIQLPWVGHHHVLNVLACAAACGLQGVGMQAFARAMQTFTGVKRRFETVRLAEGWALPSVRVLDDYGHHPNELRATIQGIRLAWPASRLVMCFQPHRYTRTRDLLASFCEVLATVDQCYVLPVYDCHEAHIDGASSQDLVRRLAEMVPGDRMPILIPSLPEALPMMLPALQAQDVLVLQGAGDIAMLGQALRVTSGWAGLASFWEQQHV